MDRSNKRQRKHPLQHPPVRRVDHEVPRATRQHAIEEIARVIIAFNPDVSRYDHVIIGLDKPMPHSKSGLTWRDLQRLARCVRTNTSS